MNRYTNSGTTNSTDGKMGQSRRALGPKVAQSFLNPIWPGLFGVPGPGGLGAESAPRTITLKLFMVLK